MPSSEIFAFESEIIYNHLRSLHPKTENIILIFYLRTMIGSKIAIGRVVGRHANRDRASEMTVLLTRQIIYYICLFTETFRTASVAVRDSSEEFEWFPLELTLCPQGSKENQNQIGVETFEIQLVQCLSEERQDLLFRCYREVICV